MSATDLTFMETALTLGRRGWGQVWPNPAVGCVLVRDGWQVVGRGWTQAGGSPHAESEALRRAGVLAAGTTAYVTLEPCSHHGRTPPCIDALVAAQVARVVVAVMDPDPRVNGQGIARLRNSGLDVMVGVCAAEARADHAGFLLRVAAGRPLVTLKLATTLDGCIATSKGESCWITGPTARAHTHRLRAEHDAVMVGIGTALADDPDLTCRLPGLTNRSPVRIVVDSRLRLPCWARVLAGTVPTWVVCSATAQNTPVNARAADSLIKCGTDIIPVAVDDQGRPHPAALLTALGARGLTRLLVEGGGQLSSSLLHHGLVDRLIWFHAPKIVGSDGVPSIAPFGLERISACPLFTRVQTMTVGKDLMTLYERVAK
ncbi:Diaminohydroxyphosphoribosylaminopyrimidine deaminase / 5-amino-6-(5- phosphoribosylamino)uracil reductase [invertebrate metagenome]|uniref:Diaminohydroxyphosphoribosylaminopyrimidine deaminase / 5-amino-6-(5- phosphoribosylamino)uracil reductase n=1 Tax=invertebrate metagenome TaxID=1711999 RepID=A0A484H542_9ZZZZ